MGWFRRLFGKRKASADDEETGSRTAVSTLDRPESAATSDAGVEEKAEDKAEAETAPAAEDDVADVDAVAEIESEQPKQQADDEPTDSALSMLDTERTTALLAEQEPAEDGAAESTADDSSDRGLFEPVTAVPEDAEDTAETGAEATEAAPQAEVEVSEPESEGAADGESAEETGGPYGPGSANPLPDGSAPSEEFTVKGNTSSKLFHTNESPYYGRTKAKVWFKTPEDAKRAGFTAWNEKKNR